MKKISLILLAMMILSGCAASNITKVQNKRGPALDVLQKENVKIYYYYTNYGEGFRSWGWYGWQYTCDKDGNIIQKREYWIGNNELFKEFRGMIKQGIDPVEALFPIHN
jgi:hypothetical protein